MGSVKIITVDIDGDKDDRIPDLLNAIQDLAVITLTTNTFNNIIIYKCPKKGMC